LEKISIWQQLNFLTIKLQLTVVGMNNEESGVALQAIEFWSTVCDEEIELQLHAEEVGLKYVVRVI
jgi:hypothetical protein